MWRFSKWWLGGSDSVIAAAVVVVFLAPLLAVPGMLLEWLRPATSQYSAAIVVTMIGMIVCLALYALVALKLLYHALSAMTR
jgi:hypothetical protein